MTKEQQLPTTPCVPEFMIGSVFEVGLSSVRVAFVQGETSFAGADVKRAVREFIVLEGDSYATVGQITEIAMADSEDGVIELGARPPGAVYAVGVVQLLASMELATGAVIPGVVSSPRVGGAAFSAQPDLIQRMITSRYRAQPDEGEKLIHFGQLLNAQATSVSFTPESLFGRHLAVLGATGAGKSWTLGRLVEESARIGGKVILFDAVGEFRELPEGCMHVYLGEDPHPPENSKQVAVPYFELRESDLCAIFKPTGRSQYPKLNMAMKSLKLARLEPAIAIDGTIIKAHKSKKDYEFGYRRHSEELESPVADFEIDQLNKQIENECVFPQRSPTESMVWGGPNGAEYSDCVSLINRIQDILNSPNLAPIFRPDDKPSLFYELRRFLQDDEARVLRISLQYLSFDHNAREITANAIGRHLLEIARAGYFRRHPLVTIVDEAHHFLKSGLLDEEVFFPLDSFALIAKEGRKYALSVCLATQRPRDIPEGVMSQMGTLIVHRLINDFDRQVVERATSEIDRATADSIPVLPPGEAVVTGVDFPMPLLIKVTAPQFPPHSSGPNYQKYWR